MAALLLGLAGFVYVTVPFGLAVDAKDRSRTAADAAALAGAEGALEDVLSNVGAAGFPNGFGALPDAGGLGRANAEQYAAANDAQLVEYYFDPTDGTAHATVEGDTVDGSTTRSDAVAQIDFPECSAVDVPAPPTPSPTPEPPGNGGGPGNNGNNGNGPGGNGNNGPPAPPPPPPSPAPDVDVEADCLGFSLAFTIKYSLDGPPEVHLVPGQLQKVRDALESRLVD